MHQANGDNGPEFAHLTILPGKGFPPHKHLDGWETIYILKGELGRQEQGCWAGVLIGPGQL